MTAEEYKQLVYPKSYYTVTSPPNMIFIPRISTLFRLIRSVWIGEIFEKEWNDYS